MFKSFIDCKHTNVQQFTECCLDCGYNIYTTLEEYKKDLEYRLAARRHSKLEKEIRELESQVKALEPDRDDTMDQSW